METSFPSLNHQRECFTEADPVVVQLFLTEESLAWYLIKDRIFKLLIVPSVDRRRDAAERRGTKKKWHFSCTVGGGWDRIDLIVGTLSVDTGRVGDKETRSTSS